MVLRFTNIQEVYDSHRLYACFEDIPLVESLAWIAQSAAYRVHSDPVRSVLTKSTTAHPTALQAAIMVPDQRFLDRLHRLEEKAHEDCSVRRVVDDLLGKGVSSAKLVWTPTIYYDEWNLVERAKFLDCTVPQLTKSIIVENTACSNDDCSDTLNSRYYCVVIQYITKLNGEKLLRVVRNLRGSDNRLSKKHYNFQHAPYVQIFVYILFSLLLILGRMCPKS